MVPNPDARNNPNAPATIKSPVVNNWQLTRDMGTLLNAIKPGVVEPQRTIAVQQCAYATLIRARGWLPPEIGTVTYFSWDNPGQSPRFPIYAGTLSLPESFKIDCQHAYREDAACWWIRRTNRLSQIKWGWTRQYWSRRSWISRASSSRGSRSSSRRPWSCARPPMARPNPST